MRIVKSPRPSLSQLLVVIGSLAAVVTLAYVRAETSSAPSTVASLVQFSAASYSVVEDCTTVTITVTRSGDISAAASIDYSSIQVTASERRDYITAIGRVNFAVGESSKSFAVLINEDSDAEGLETFNITLSNGQGVSLGVPVTTSVQIIDDLSESSTNVIDDPQAFVCQQYHDFLNRQPDSSGLDFWTQNITSCGNDQQCVEKKRINVSAAFYLSIEFQQTGYLVERLYKVAYGDAVGTSTFNGVHQLSVPIVRLNEFLADSQEIGKEVVVNQSGWEQKLETNKQAFISQFVQRSRFTTAIASTLTAAEFVDKLNDNAGNPLLVTERNQLLSQLVSGAKTRSQVLRAIAEHPTLEASEFKRAFVLMQYLGYLRRNPNDPQDTDYTGYDFWLTKLNEFGGNFIDAEMVKAFITAREYRERFSGSAVASAIVIDTPSVFFPSVGSSKQLTAQILDAQGTLVSGSVTWTSTAPGKVSVDAAGRSVAVAIGSAQIVAEAFGIKSAPTLVFVAQPQTGALLVTDAQVVSVGQPLGLPAGVVPGVGTQYEIKLRGLAAPTPGAVVLAAETAPIAGKVVSTRTEADTLVVRLGIAPLHELFTAYNLESHINLSAFPLGSVSTPSPQVTLGEEWSGQRSRRERGISAPKVLDDFEPFRAFDCDASIKAKLLGAPIQLSLENNLELELTDRPGYSKHALSGSLALKGNAGLKLAAGFEAEGKCTAQAQIKFPIFGWFSVIVMPAVRAGLGVEVKSEILLVQGDLAVEGKVGISGVVGWECGGATPKCSGLNSLDPLNLFKTMTKIPSENDKQAKISAHFYVLVGLDASIGVGFLNAEILEARMGPKQSFDLAFEEDQAARTDYASSYDLKMVGVVEPGSGLKKAIEKVINDDATEVSFGVELNQNLSESPKGTHTVNKNRVKPGEKVDFTVDLANNTVDYKVIGYNVTRVDLYRKRSDQSVFTFWESIPFTASHQTLFTRQWTPTPAEVGTYEIAAFVNTEIPVPMLEVSPNSIQKVEVLCVGGSTPNVCTEPTNTWVGTSSVVIRTPGLPPADNITARANINWTFERIDESGYQVYKPNGTFTLEINVPSSGCTMTLSPSTFLIDNAQQNTNSVLFITPGETRFYGFNGHQFVSFTSTKRCPGIEDRVTPVMSFLVDYAFGNGDFTGQDRLFGSFEDAALTYTWDFSRP